MLLKFPNLENHQTISHFVSTRKGGFSKPPFHECNMSYNVGDDAQIVTQNREQVCAAMGIALHQLCVPQQTHSTHIYIVTKNDAGKGATDFHTGIAHTDGLLTHEKNIMLMVFSADCVMTLFYDTKLHVIGAVHAGWRGTVAKITAKMITTMQEVYGSSPENICVGIAPAIGCQVYEVGEEVTQAVITAFGTTDKYMHLHSVTQKYHLDLHYANKQQLLAVGVREPNIQIMDICTFTQSDNFFSSRADKGITGRFSAGIMLQ
jgi:YfiH family protein